MKHRLIVAISLGTLLVAGLLGGTAPAGAKGKKAAGPLVVGTDPEGDWGQDVDPQLAPLGDATGQDLVEASIEMADAKTVNFMLKVTSLPAPGGMPEFVRYIWDFNVDGEYRELDGKFTNYTRGACDPTSGQCPPPRDPGMQPFILRAECGPHPAASNLTFCQELGVIQASFDAAEGTITIPVPLDAMGAKPGSKITPAANIFGGSISAAPSAFLTSGSFPMDYMTVLKTFKIPK